MTTATAHPYTRPDGTAYSERDAATIEKFAADLVSGRVFHRAAASADSRFGYQPPAGSRNYGEAMRRLGVMASQGDQLAQVAAGIFGRVNLYGTQAQAIAAIWRAGAAAVEAGYTDVLGRTGPEAGRPSSYEHPTTLRMAATIAVWLHTVTAAYPEAGPGPVGWCLAAICRALDITPGVIEQQAGAR